MILIFLNFSCLNLPPFQKKRQFEANVVNSLFTRGVCVYATNSGNETINMDVVTTQSCLQKAKDVALVSIRDMQNFAMRRKLRLTCRVHVAS